MMKKDKLITIRVNEQIRDKFNQWCNEQGLSASEFLSNIIEDCVSGNYEMSSNNKDKSQKIARQKLIALEAKIEDLSSQINSLTLIAQEGANLKDSASQYVDKIGVLEKQIDNILSQGYSISNLIDNQLDKNELEALIESKIDSVLDLSSLSNKLDDQLDKFELENLIQAKIDSIFNLNSILEKIDNKLDKNELEVLIESKIDSVFNLNSLLEKIDNKLDNKLDKLEAETLVQTFVNSTFNQNSLSKMIDIKIDTKWADLQNQITKSGAENNNLAKPIDNHIDKDSVNSRLELEESLEQPLENKYIEANEIEGVLIEENNPSINSDYQEVQFKPLTSEFLALPVGKLNATEILKALKIKDTGYLSRVAKNGLEPQFESFWEYLEYDTSQKRIAWRKLK